MQKRLALVATLAVALIASLAFAAPALATSWLGLYVPGAPSSMAPVTTVQNQLGSHVAVVNFFVADTEAFPTQRCQNISAAGATPLVTLEFWSTQSGGLASITNGSKDAYLKTFAAAAKSYGKTVWLRPFHEMNGNWYPWGTTGNTPAQLIAAYRHVHNVFASAGASNVKFVWCPNVDFNVSSFYPGNAYVDYAAIDGYNNGKPWRSFGSIFGTTYNAVAAASSKPIFIAETSSVEGGSGKAAWISSMFGQIASKYTRIVGVCWFDAKQTYDWRVDTSASSIAALKAGFAGVAYVPVKVGSSLSIKTSAKSVKRKHALKISGVLKPGRSGSRVRIAVTIPRHAGSSKSLKTSSSGSWSFRYTPTVKGTYYLRVSFTGDSTRRANTSKKIKFVVK